MKTIKDYSYEDIAEGYIQMGDINLEISQEFFHLEEEGEKIHNGMGTKRKKIERKI